MERMILSLPAWIFSHIDLDTVQHSVGLSIPYEYSHSQEKDRNVDIRLMLINRHVRQTNQCYHIRMAYVAYLPASTMCAKIDVVEGKRGHPAYLSERSGPMLV